MTPQQAARYAATVTDHLFTSGSGQRAARLVLVPESREAGDLGGWCRRAVESAVRRALAGELAAPHPPLVDVRPMPLARDVLTRDAVRDSLHSEVCPVCGGGKAERVSFCQECWDRVPGPTQQALVPHVNTIYVDALFDAMEHLGAAVFHAEAKP